MKEMFIRLGTGILKLFRGWGFLSLFHLFLIHTGFFFIYQPRSLAYTSSCEFAQQREVAINKVVIKVSEKNGNSRGWGVAL